MYICGPNCVLTQLNLPQLFGRVPSKILGGGEGSEFDSEDCAVPPISLVALAVVAVVDMIG